MTTAAARTALLDPSLVERLPGLVTAPPGRPTQPSYAPFDGALVGEVPTCAPEDVAEAQRRARVAHGGWAARPLRPSRCSAGCRSAPCRGCPRRSTRPS